MDSKILIKEYTKDLADFFGIDAIPMDIKICGSWEALAKEYNEAGFDSEAPKWLKGFSGNRTVYVLGPGIMPKGNELSAKMRFKKIIKHEMAHRYYRELKGNGYPSWLNEGVALYVAGQEKYDKPQGVTIKALDKYHDRIEPDIYALGLFMVKEIIDNYGKDKLFEIIKMGDRNIRYTELKRMFGWLK